MIALPKKEVLMRNFAEMTSDELDSEWSEARECLDHALVKKTETDRAYVAAATRLNTVERLVRKVEKRAAVAKRAAAKSLLRSATAAAQDGAR